jgi:hypothetical protein
VPTLDLHDDADGGGGDDGGGDDGGDSGDGAEIEPGQDAIDDR